MKLDNYEGQAVMITGAASGFGELLALELADRGAKLVIGDRNEPGLQRVAEAVRAKGAEVFELRCDVTCEAEVRAMVEVAVTRYGRLDVGVNNAGMSAPMKAFIETDEADLDLVYAVNAKGTFFGMKHQITQMLAQGEGVILNVASLAGLGGARKLAAYAAAKHAVVGLTRTAAVEYAHRNIRVNAVCPFYCVTPMVTDTDMAAKQEIFAQASPMKRLGRPAEVVAAMLMLCSRENSYMTGQAVAVDGGIFAK